eukprot:COSAG01_NODE_398_length_17547_cov_206.793501_16_plen_201_part_00
MSRIRNHSNPLSFIEAWKPFKQTDYFADAKLPMDFEIGFGRGVFIRNRAESCPDRNIIGLEVRKGIVSELEASLDRSYTNLVLIQGNAVTFMRDALPDLSVDKLFIFHPDPWFKNRHHKRRIIGPIFCAAARKKLKTTGRIYFASDVKELWEDQKNFLIANGFEEIQDPLFWESYYQTHWAKFSKIVKRESYMSVFKIKN